MNPTLYVAARQGMQQLLPEMASSMQEAGLDGCEPFFQSADQVAPAGALLRQHGLAMHTCCTTARLHDDSAPDAIQAVLELGSAAKPWGASVIAVAPKPVRQDLPIEKGEYELRRQSLALEELGARLAEQGLMLAYIPQAYAMRSKAREFERMLQTTTPESVSLGLAADWIYRETGDNAQLLEDLATRYAARIKILYLCPPQMDGLWAVVQRMARLFTAQQVHLLIVLDCTFAPGAPGIVEAYRQGRAAVEAIFGAAGSQNSAP